jgi:hypothetical protein
VASKEEPKLTESEFLEQEAERARMGMSRALENVKRDLAEAANPAAWVREFPFASVVAALAAGFATGFATKKRAADEEEPREPKEPLLVEGRFRGLGRPARRRHRTVGKAVSVGARWAARSLLRGFMPV